MPGLIVGKNIIGISGQVLVGKGYKLNQRIIQQLKEHGILEVPILQSIDLLDPLSPNRLSRKQIFYDKKSDAQENYQLLANKIISDELLHTVLVHLRSFYSHLNEFDAIEMKIRNLIDQICKDLHVISILSMMKCLDHKSILRYSRVTAIGLMIGIDMGIEHEKLISLGKACLFYNIGHFILMKNFKITNLSKWKQTEQIYQSHSLIGSTYLSDFFDEDVARAALEHHERFAGGGTPNNKSGSEIALISKIVSVAGRFVSMKYNNSLRVKCKRDLAMDYIFNVEGTMFDTNVVNSFRKHITPYPIGTVLELSDGSRGIVIKNGIGPDYEPMIKIVIAKSTIFNNGDFINTKDLEDIYIRRELMIQ